jgi:hypothetical protein
VVGGIYSPQPPTSHWGRLLSMGAQDSPVRHQTLSGAAPRHPTVRVRELLTEDLSSCGTGLSGAPLTYALTSAAHCLRY